MAKHGFPSLFRYLPLGLALCASAAASSPLTEKQKIEHLLSRAAFGPTPALTAEVEKEGREAWLEKQLHPESIPDSALETKLKAYPSLNLSMEELEENYPQPEMATKDDAKRPAEILVEISRQKILRAVESRRQLSEVL
ncbi:MAG: DUF1800 family protein, partial [Bdellovibrionota bacterium]